MALYTSIEQLVGNTPLVELCAIQKAYNLKARLLAKIEYFNPAGSVKDRVALEMIIDAEERGALKKGSTIIEPTSGNTGIGLASIAVARGYKVIIVMPDSMSQERRSLIASYGAELVLSDGKDGMQGAIAKAEELHATIKNSFIAGQFDNSANVRAHYRTTAKEIWDDTCGKVDYFVAGVGTGGTITGVGRFLKEKNPSVKIVAVEPADSSVLSGKKAGAHKLQGIGAGFVPKILDTSVYNSVVAVSTEDAYECARLICKKEGFCVGISSGASLFAAINIAKKDDASGKTVVALLPDTGMRYLSTPGFLV